MDRIRPKLFIKQMDDKMLLPAVMQAKHGGRTEYIACSNISRLYTVSEQRGHSIFIWRKAHNLLYFKCSNTTTTGSDA